MASDSSLIGSIVEADAIAYYTKKGYVVSIPFTPTYYDLLIEKDDVIYRVQCKKARFDALGKNVINLRSKDKGYSSEYYRTKFDYIYSIDSNGDRYIIDSKSISGGRQIYLSKKYIVNDDRNYFENTKSDENVRRCKRCGRKLEPNYNFKCCESCRDKAAASNRKRRALKKMDNDNT